MLNISFLNNRILGNASLKIKEAREIVSSLKKETEEKNNKLEAQFTEVNQNNNPSEKPNISGDIILSLHELISSDTKQSDNGVQMLEQDASSVMEGGNLSDEEKAKVSELEKIDMQVKTHENAHRAAGGKFTKPASYSYIEGPDGEQYAVAGEVAIDISPVKGNPEATITKMKIVKKAALAPASPSSADRAVAGKASAIEAEARTELMKERQAENNQESNNKDDYFALVKGYGKENADINSYSFVAQDA